MDIRKMKYRLSAYLKIIVAIVIVALLITLSGCESSAQKGTVLGAGIGALAGQAIGGDTESTLIGAAVGLGAGYIIGNEKDKKAAQQHDYNTPTPLTGTRWKVVSLVMEDRPEYEWMTVEFRPDGKIVSTRFEPGGPVLPSAVSADERAWRACPWRAGGCADRAKAVGSVRSGHPSM